MKLDNCIKGPKRDPFIALDQEKKLQRYKSVFEETQLQLQSCLKVLLVSW